MSKKSNKTIIALILGALATGVAFFLRGMSMKEEKPAAKAKKTVSKKKAKK